MSANRFVADCVYVGERGREGAVSYRGGLQTLPLDGAGGGSIPPGRTRQRSARSVMGARLQVPSSGNSYGPLPPSLLLPFAPATIPPWHRSTRPSPRGGAAVRFGYPILAGLV